MKHNNDTPPALGTEVRIFYKHQHQYFPGRPAVETVTVITGRLVAYVEPNKLRSEGFHGDPKVLDKILILAKSKYQRWFIEQRRHAAPHYPKEPLLRAVKLDDHCSWVLLAEAETV